MNAGRIQAAADPTGKVQKITETVDRLYRRGATRTLQRIFAKLHPADLCAALSVLPEEHLVPVFETISDAKLAAEVLAELDYHAREMIVEELGADRLAPILEQLPPDELTDLIQEMPEAVAADLMARLKLEDQQELEELLVHEPHTAGGLMTPDFFALSEGVSVEEAIAQVREHYDVELVSYVYVVDEQGRLTGIVSLRQLILSDPHATLGSIMNRRIVSVRPGTAEEQVAELIDKYQLLALPVVDEDNVLIGVVTIDDVFEVVEAQATQHILRMAGTDQSEIRTQSPLRIAFIRVPWLAAAFFGGLIATNIIQHFQHTLASAIALAAFLPVVMGMAGNVGVQTASVAIRSLAVGNLLWRNAHIEVFKEVRVGLALGIVYGALLAGFGWSFYDDLRLAQVVGATLLVNMTGAALLGIGLPLAFWRLGADPAVATGPFVTTAIDALGVLTYLLIANAILT